MLEALAVGVPIVASDLPVLREIGGECACYFPVGDAQLASIRLRSVLRGESFGTIAKRQEILKKLTWENAALGYKEVILRLANKNR